MTTIIFYRADLDCLAEKIYKETNGLHTSSRIINGFVFLILLIGLLAATNLVIGSVSFSPSEVIKSLTGQGDGTLTRILYDIRLPRLLAALLLGGALSVSGLLLQTFFHNPIAGPYVLGVSSASKLVVALMMIFCLNRGMVLSSALMVGAAFAGAMLAMGFVLLAAAKVKSMEILVICGVIVGYFCSAATEFVVTFADDSNIVNLHYWSMGSFSGIGWEQLRILSVFVVLGMTGTIFLAKPMSAYQLGEGYAAALGVPIRLFRIALILLSGLLTATVTAFAGPVSFVGMAVPHLVRVLFSTEKPLLLIPAVFLGGSCFCLFADLAARMLFAPTELSISAVTSVIGAPIVIGMLLQKQSKEL